ncbi:Detected protein of confused Function [Hibiscus syriacus]|uniref:Detected protein of confused Function n=1 Tax=Hibiscus syriacus TaxID=106335 RepID=A0A6A3BUA1_HIBSY|nr:Detected protein of confused Function [Hibiscus syriacus]
MHMLFIPVTSVWSRKNVVPICDDIMAVDWGEILGEIKGINEGIPGVQQLTCGENFSARAKGFSLASVSGHEEMEAAVGKEEYVNLQKQKVRDNLDGVIVVDYVVPTLSP